MMMNTMTLSAVARRVLVRPGTVARAWGSTTAPQMMQGLYRQTFSTQVKEVPHTEREIQGGLNSEQLLVLDQMFGKLENLEQEVKVLRQQLKDLGPTFAVDGPDGDSLGHELEEQQEVNHIIEEAALHEDTQHVEKVHKLEDDVQQYHARDPEHDW